MSVKAHKRSRPSSSRPDTRAFQAKTPLLAGLKLLQDRRIHLGIVFAGRTRLGIVTLEDILEEVVRGHLR
ncbi:MAG: hypothetical protein H0V35_15310 [Nitrospira sp.]|nr:hypothetical protein [Nitrospira sp.]